MEEGGVWLGRDRGQSQLAKNSHIEGEGEGDGAVPGMGGGTLHGRSQKTNEHFRPCQVRWAVGWNLWFMIQFHASLQRL